MGSTLMLVDGYARSKRGQEPKPFRRMTRAEILSLHYGAHVHLIANDGKVRTAKVNGSVKAWKRDPNRFEVALKYGMYEYVRWDAATCLERLVIPLETVD